MTKAGEYVEQHVGNNEMYLVMEGMKVIKALFRHENSTYELKAQVHEGLYQDSVLITDWLHGYVDFRYFPRGEMQPYHWSDGLEKIHIYNIGICDFFFKGTKENILCKVNEIVEISKQKYCGEMLLSPDAVNGKCMFTINAEEIKRISKIS